MTNIKRSLCPIIIKIRRSASFVYTSLDFVIMTSILLSSTPLVYYVYKLVIGLEQHKVAWIKHNIPFIGFSKNTNIFLPIVDLFSLVARYNGV
jgi:hypothetical protein